MRCQGGNHMMAEATMRPWMMAMSICLIATAAQAGPVPKDVVGTWSDQQECPKDARKMIFAATEVTVVQDDGRRKSVRVDATGSAAERLEVRVTKVLSPLKADAGGAHVGDILVIRLEDGHLRLLGQGDASGVHEANGPPLYRCGG
jgi:hypothetical protein